MNCSAPSWYLLIRIPNKWWVGGYGIDTTFEMIMKKFRLVSLIAFLFVDAVLFGQSKVHFEVSGGYMGNLSLHSKLAAFDSGWTLGLGLSYTLNRRVSFLATGAYHVLPLAERGIVGIEPPIIGSRPIVGAKSENSKMYELAIASRIFSNGGRHVWPFITLRGGVFLVEVGQIVGGGFVASAGEQYYRGFGSLGIGVLLPVHEKLKLLFEGRLVATFANEEFLPLTCSIQF